MKQVAITLAITLAFHIAIIIGIQLNYAKPCAFWRHVLPLLNGNFDIDNSHEFCADF